MLSLARVCGKGIVRIYLLGRRKRLAAQALRHVDNAARRRLGLATCCCKTLKPLPLHMRSGRTLLALLRYRCHGTFSARSTLARKHDCRSYGYGCWLVVLLLA